MGDQSAGSADYRLCRAIWASRYHSRVTVTVLGHRDDRPTAKLASTRGGFLTQSPSFRAIGCLKNARIEGSGGGDDMGYARI